MLLSGSVQSVLYADTFGDLPQLEVGAEPFSSLVRTQETST